MMRGGLYQWRLSSLRARLRTVSRKRPVLRTDCLVTRAGRLRCEAWVDPLDAETPFVLEVQGGTRPLTLFGGNLDVLFEDLRRASASCAEMAQLFDFGN